MAVAFYLALRFGLFLARVFPLRPFVGLVSGCLGALARFSPKRHIVARNVAALALAADRPPVAPREVFASYGRYWGELLAFVRKPSLMADLPLRIEGEEHLRCAAERGPVCILSAHVGNWDLLAFWLARRLPDFTVVAEELKPARLFDLFKGMREAGGCRVLVADGQGLRLYRHLKQGGSVGLMADRVFGSGSELGQGQRVARLVGGCRRLPSAGLDLARRAGATLLPVFLLRENGGYVIKVHAPLPEAADPVQAFARALECTILEYPEQWVVLYALHDAVCEQLKTDELVKGAAAL